MLEANFSSIILIAFRALELQYESIINDIELGIVKPDLKISDDVRDELNKLLNPDKKRANELREAFKGGVSGLARRIWPECHLVLSADTGVYKKKSLKIIYCYLIHKQCFRLMLFTIFHRYKFKEHITRN
jgi:hypothetical protein